ncbi:MAG: flavodoxin-dependent (E)-4-hydroxy-3-methylbut-2-enyl-diphosphate synthase, partial [Clostridia bacterium]|nr:flavodoxin-dependent (E)-4-hydroxy-3-methylbut-2-enyl-diphosphate synthase [Clostridia bacterium]
MIYNNIRRKSREVTVGIKKIGGNAPIAIQSMTNTDTLDAVATIAQIRAMEEKGCDIVRVSVPTLEAADTILKIKEAGIRIPIVADIHFDYKIALRCAEL